MRRTSSMLLCALLILTAFAFFGPSTVVTDVSAEIVEGEGNCFEITNSTYLNVTLCSSEVVNVSLESIPEVVSFGIRNVTSAQSTEITISGFEPGKTYYRHEDGYLIESFVADQEGNHSYTQDLSEPHHVFIQEEAGTKYIKDDATGGDCTSIGTWDSGTKTCLFTNDVHETVVIASDGITLDGGGHSVTKGVGSYGIYASLRSGITITNSLVSGFSVNIHLGASHSNTISGNTVSGSYNGIYLYLSSGNTISGNTVSGSHYYGGISLGRSSGNTISGNTVSGGVGCGICLGGSGSSTVSGNTISDNEVGLSVYQSGSVTVTGNTISGNRARGISLGRWSGGSTITGNTISGGKGYGIYVTQSGSVTISGNIVSGSYNGIYLYRSGSVTISGNTISDSSGSPIVLAQSVSNTISENTISGSSNFGIRLGSSHSNTISGNTVTGSYKYHVIDVGGSNSNTISGNIVSGSSNYGGITLGYSSSSNTIVWNTVSDNYYGIWLHSSNDNTFFCNILVDNTNQLYNYASTNTWDNGTGDGNYWDDYLGEDLDGDGDGDTLLPHQGVDWHPLMSPCSANTAPEICSFTTTPGVEGTAVVFTVYASDGENDPLTYSFDFDSDGIIDESGSSNTASFTWYDDYTGTATVEVSDGEYTVEATAPVLVTNEPPDVLITGPAAGSIYPVNTPVEFTGSFTDVGTGDIHTAEWIFESDLTIEAPGTVTESGGSGTVTDLYAFAAAGVYMVTLTVTDDDGGVGTANLVGDLTAMVVIYNPEGGFVTGGGWYWSSPGGYFGDPELEGKVNFGFVAKYHKGADVPKGNTEFRFQAAGMDFHSTSYDWLVISGPRAQFKGTGTINGEGDYAFKLTVIDGDLPGGGGVDRIRMKIWDKGTGLTVYDTNVEMDDNDGPLTPLGGGEIKIHEG